MLRNAAASGVGLFGFDAGVASADGTSAGDVGVSATISSSDPLDVGSVATDETWSSVDVSGFTDPVVLAPSLSYEGGQVASPRLRSVTDTGFDVKVEEYDYMDETHATETVGFVVAEAGQFTMDQGVVAEAGRVQTDENWTSVSFSQTFGTKPLVFTSAQTYNGGQAVVTRNRNVSTGGFEVRCQEGEQYESGGHATEAVGYLAVVFDAGIADGGRVFEVGAIQDVTDSWTTHEFEYGYENPIFVADMLQTDGGNTATVRYRNLTPTSVEVQIDEERSADDETGHTTEHVGYLATGADSSLAKSTAKDGTTDNTDVPIVSTKGHYYIDSKEGWFGLFGFEDHLKDGYYEDDYDIPDGQAPIPYGEDEVVVYCHGWRNRSLQDGIDSAAEVMHSLEDPTAPDGSFAPGWDGGFVGYVWDSAIQPGPEVLGIAYSDQEDVGYRNGTAAAGFVDTLQWKDNPDTDVHWVAHSMGAHVTLGLLEYLDSVGRSIQSVTLWAPACPADWFSKERHGGLVERTVGKFRVFYSQDDYVLHPCGAYGFEKGLTSIGPFDDDPDYGLGWYGLYGTPPDNYTQYLADDYVGTATTSPPDCSINLLQLTKQGTHTRYHAPNEYGARTAYGTLNVSGGSPAAYIDGPFEALTDESVTFSAADAFDSVAGGDDLSFDWSSPDTTLGDTTGGSITVSFSSEGDYRIVLEVTDADGNTGTAQHTVSVTHDYKPTADIDDPGTIAVGYTGVLDGSGSSDQDGTIVEYEWWDGYNGTTRYGESIEVTFESTGDYDFTLTVTDDVGQTDTASTTVSVVDPDSCTDSEGCSISPVSYGLGGR